MLQLPNKPKTRGIINIEEINDMLQSTTTSRKIATKFKKEHKYVLKRINKILEKDDNFNEVNFAPVEYIDKKGEKRTEYNMTFEGFMLVVMGFTGEKALEIKKTFITMFRQMAEYIKQNEIYRISVDSRNKMNSALKSSGLTEILGDDIDREVARKLINEVDFHTFGTRVNKNF